MSLLTHKEVGEMYIEGAKRQMNQFDFSRLPYAKESHIGEQGISNAFIWKSIITLIIALLVLSYFVAG